MGPCVFGPPTLHNAHVKGSVRQLRDALHGGPRPSLPVVYNLRLHASMAGPFVQDSH